MGDGTAAVSCRPDQYDTPSTTSRRRRSPASSTPPRDVAEREAGPPPQILGAGWAVAGEVAGDQLGQRLVGVAGGRRRHARVQQRVCVVLAAHRPAAYEALELGVHQDVPQGEACGRQARATEDTGQLLAGAVPATVKCLGE